MLDNSIVLWRRKYNVLGFCSSPEYCWKVIAQDVSFSIPHYNFVWCVANSPFIEYQLHQPLSECIWPSRLGVWLTITRSWIKFLDWLVGVLCTWAKPLFHVAPVHSHVLSTNQSVIPALFLHSSLTFWICHWMKGWEMCKCAQDYIVT